MTSDLDNLDKKITEAKATSQSIQKPRRKPDENMNTGLSAGAELTGAIIAGGLIGWALDQWLQTKPIFLIIFLLLGVVTGFVNVWRVTNNMGTQIGYSQLHRRQKLSKTLPDNEIP